MNGEVGRAVTRIFDSFAGPRVVTAAAEMTRIVRRSVVDGTVPEHPKYIINYVLEGEATMHASGGAKVSVGPGCFVQRTSLEHEPLEWHPGKVKEFYFCMHEPIGHALHSLGLYDSSRKVIQAGVTDEAIVLCRRLYAVVENKEETWTAFLQRLAELMGHIFRHKIAAGSGQYAWLDHTCTILGADHNLRYSLADIAEEVGVSVEKMRKDFKAAYQVSPGEFRIRRRIEQACRMLLTMPVKEVAYELGYPDPKTFSRQFRRFTGMTPMQHRREG